MNTSTLLLALAVIALASYVAHLIAVIKADGVGTRPPASHHPDLFDPQSRWTRSA